MPSDHGSWLSHRDMHINLALFVVVCVVFLLGLAVVRSVFKTLTAFVRLLTAIVWLFASVHIAHYVADGAHFHVGH